MMGMKRKGVLGIVLVGLIAAGAWVATDWGKYRWEQEVVLRDGGSLWVKRTTVFRHHGELIQMRRSSPFADGFSFKHPKTGERIVWPLNENVRPLLLDFDQGIPYLVTDINAGKYRNMGCPPHQYAFFKYANGEWQRIGVKALPAQIERSNMVPYLDNVTRELFSTTDRAMDARMVQQQLMAMPRDVQLIDRRIVNPLFFCEGSVDNYYPIGTTKKLQDRFGTNPARNVLIEQDAIEFGIATLGDVR